jgi:hypothetical protein
MGRQRIVMRAARGRAVSQTNDEGEGTEMQPGRAAGCRRRTAHRTARYLQGQAAIGVAVVGNWLRAGIAIPALSNAATRLVSSGWDDISSARLIQKL